MIDLYENFPLFVYLLRIHEALMAVNVFICIYFIFRIYNVALIHVNLRILLCNIPLLFILMNLTRFAAYSWENHAHQFPAKLANSICLTLRLIEELGVGCLGVCIPQITFERAFATVFRKTYEKQGARLGIGMTVQTYVASALLSFTLIAYQLFIAKDFNLNDRYSTCRLESHYTLIYFGIWIVAFFIASNATALLFLAYYYNRRTYRRQDSFHLPTRYQFRENIQILRGLLPPISFFMLSDLAGLCCIGYALLWERSDRNIRLVLQLLHIIPQVFCLSTTIWFMFSFNAIRQRVNEDLTMLSWKNLFKKNRVNTGHNPMLYQMDVVNTQENHFAVLRSNWGDDIKFDGEN
ncbi:hypothetical protein M3Y97_00327900 [Aphelenchoides bicaudatus]|nr:hypothetical protein M3Y97_00327900 [Aphelenchoides bicaudatus]